MDNRKVLDDWLIATQETISTLQSWVRLLDQWRAAGQVDPGDFAAASQQLCEAGLGAWANVAGGHGVAALAQALEVEMYEGIDEYRSASQMLRRR